MFGTLLCVLACWPALGRGASIDALHRDIIEKNWEAAELLIPELARDPSVDHYDLLFSVGMMSVQRKDYPRAIQAFREILATRPELTRVRLELARALYLNGDDNAARLHFERVLGGDIPAPVAANVRRYLAAIRSKKSWSLNISLGYIADSNANNGTEQDIVHFFGVPFRVGDSAKQQSGSGVSLWAKGTYRFKLTDQTGIMTFASVARRDYQNSSYDDMTMRVGAGPSWSGKSMSINVMPLLAYRTYGNEPYSRSAGIRTEWNAQLANRWTMDVNTEWLDTRNAISSAYDEKNSQLNAYLYYVPDSRTTFRIGSNLQQVNSRTSYLGYTSAGVSLGVFRDWTHGVTTGLSWLYQRAAYKDVQPFFNAKRNDAINVFSLSVGKRDWAIAGFMPVLSLTHIRDASSIDFFSYKRTVVELHFDQRF